jgi:ketosteroid isomerase-like protein
MPERPPLELLRRAYDALSTEDIATLRACAHPELELRTAAAGVFHGPDGVEDWLAVMRATWESWRFEVDRIEPGLGERWLVVGVLSGRSRLGEAPAAQRFWVVWEIADGRMRRGTHYTDESAARRAALAPEA